MILERGIQVTVKYLNMVHLQTISLPLYEVWGVSQYRGCGFAVLRSCGSHSERNLVVRFSIEVYESKTLFSLLFSKYWS